MPAKEIKIALKEVREAIKSKEILTAIRKCDEVLNEEPKNYMALVLMGAAYQEKDKKEAAKYLRRAVEASGDIEPTIALQGLVNCAEIIELPEIYRKLLRLVPEKAIDYHSKIVIISENNKNIENCIEILKIETKLEVNETNSNRINSAWKCLAKVLIKLPEIPDKWQNLWKPSLTVAMEDIDSPLHLEYMKRFLKQLYKLNELENLLKTACLMFEKYPNEMYPLEWICKIYSDNTNLNFQTLLNKPIDIYVDQLLELASNSISGIYVKSYLHYNKDEFVIARDLLLTIKDKSKSAQELLAKCYIQIGAFNMAENIYQLNRCDDKLFAECLSHSNNIDSLKEGFILLEKFDQNNLDVLEQLVRISFKLHEKEILSKTMEKIQNLNDNERYLLLEAEFIKTPEEGLINLEKLSNNNFAVELLKGKLYLKLSQHENSLMSLLKATKMKPYKCELFLNLGLVYFAIKDFPRAKKCFEKSLTLNPYYENALTYLCGLYRQNEELDLNAAILEKVIQQLPTTHAKFAYFQQGLHFMCTKNYDEAIHAFRTALRYDLTKILYWEFLADSYRERGSYVSSMRVFEKILELDSNNCYAKLQIAGIKSTLRLYNESIECFEELLVDEPNYLPALKGAAEAHYNLAENLLPQRLLGRAKEHFQIAFDHLQKIFLLDKRNMIWLWRLSANIFVNVACMPTSKSFLKVAGQLTGEKNKVCIEIKQKELFELALKYYSVALKLSSDDTYLWQELSLCAFSYAAMPNQNTDEQEKQIDLSIKYCKYSIKCQSNRWQTWNLLGVLYTLKRKFHKPNLSLAQHYFIKALNLNKRSAMTWTNLGVLYLKSDEIKLANQSFNRAQQSEPQYANAWIGQASIAEKLAEDEEAMDLFRHCTQLDYHQESALGYSRWVCKIISDENLMKQQQFKYAIKNMHALTLALDSMTWYLAAEDDIATPESFSYFGYLNVCQKIWNMAIIGFSKAAEKIIDNVKQKDEMLYNLGFCYLKIGLHEKATIAFKAISEKSLKSIVGLALSYSLAGNYTESYVTYNSALECATATEKEKAEILVAMSAMIYSFQGEEDTKKILYQCIQLEERPIEALYSACALGIIHGDKELAEVVLNELQKFDNNSKYYHHIAFLTAQLYLSKQQPKRALNYLLSKVHVYPHSSELRKVLASFLVNNFSKTTKYSKGACQVAQSINDLNYKSSKRNNSIDAAKALLIASEAIKNVDKIKQSKLIQRAIHMHPDSQLAWNALNSCKV